MKLSFFSKCSITRRTASPRYCVDKVARKGAFSIEHLMVLCEQGKPIPSLKQVNYTPDGAKDLRFSSVDPRNLTELFELGKKKASNDALLSDYNAKVAKDNADAEFNQKVNDAVNQRLNDLQKSPKDSQS